MSIFEICFILYYTVRTLRKNSGSARTFAMQAIRKINLGKVMHWPRTMERL